MECEDHKNVLVFNNSVKNSISNIATFIPEQIIFLSFTFSNLLHSHFLLWPRPVNPVLFSHQPLHTQVYRSTWSKLTCLFCRPTLKAEVYPHTGYRGILR